MHLNPFRRSTIVRVGKLQPVLLMLHLLQLFHHRRTRVDALDELDLLAFFERHYPARSGNNASARDEEACGPRGAVVAVEAPLHATLARFMLSNSVGESNHKAAQASLKGGVPDVAPDVEVEFPEFGGRGADAG